MELPALVREMKGYADSRMETVNGLAGQPNRGAPEHRAPGGIFYVVPSIIEKVFISCEKLLPSTDILTDEWSY